MLLDILAIIAGFALLVWGADNFVNGAAGIARNFGVSPLLIGLTIVGPEVPLVLGVVDRFRAAGLKCFGPTQAAAQLEGSKTFTKDFLARHNIPTAAYRAFTDVGAAVAYIREQGTPIVIKADGLARGKGVFLPLGESDAQGILRALLERWPIARQFGLSHLLVVEKGH